MVFTGAGAIGTREEKAREEAPPLFLRLDSIVEEERDDDDCRGGGGCEESRGM